MTTFYQTTRRGVKIIAPTKTLLNKLKQCVDLVPKRDVGLKTILITPTKGEGGAFYQEEKTYVVEGGSFTRNDITWEASCLLHEFRHAWQKRNWSKKNCDDWNKAETDAARCQMVFLFMSEREDLIKRLKKQLKKQWWKKDGKDYTPRGNILDKWLDKYIKKQIKIKAVG